MFKSAAFFEKESCPKKNWKSCAKEKMKILIGSDHAGYKLKEELKRYLESSGYELEDYGTNSEQKVDYPKFGYVVANNVAKSGNKGILICGSGIGMSIVANKVKGVRAAACHDEYTAKVAREHNDANVLCLGARVLKEGEAKKIAKVFLETSFSKEERHKRRVDEIKNLEKKC